MCVGSIMKELLSNERHRETLRVYRKFCVVHFRAQNVRERKALLLRTLPSIVLLFNTTANCYDFERSLSQLWLMKVQHER